MISMYTKQEIILKSHRDGMGKRAIARELGISRVTVTKYIKAFEKSLSQSPSPEAALGEELSTKARYDTSNRPKRKLTPEITKAIDGILEENERKRLNGLRKQVLKNMDIHGHLKALGFDIGYTTVCAYISSRKGKGKRPEAFIRQQYAPGSVCEFDWGEVTLEIDGRSGRYYLAVFTTAYGNYRFAQLFSRQDTLAFLESHVNFFAHAGVVFAQMVYDNMRVAVARFAGTEKEPTEALLQLRGHYRFTHRFTNFRRGNEKGHVERSVEHVRRKSFGPRHAFGSMEEAQGWLAKKLVEINRTRQQLTGKTALELFEQEKGALPAVQVPMECAQWVSLRVDKYATVSYGTNRYSVPDHLVGAFVTVKVRTDRLEVFEDRHRVALHARSYGKHGWTIDIDHYLETFRRKPGALAGSVALASSKYLKELFEAHFQGTSREFIDLLGYCRKHGVSDKRLNEVVQRLHKSGVRQITAAKIEALLGNKMEDKAPPPTGQTAQNALAQLQQISSFFN